MLDPLPISTFIVPGLFLFLVLGIAPLILIHFLQKWVTWAWSAAIVLSLVLLGWLIGQLLLWGSPIPIQQISLFVGLLMLSLSVHGRLRFE